MDWLVAGSELKQESCRCVTDNAIRAEFYRRNGWTVTPLVPQRATPAAQRGSMSEDSIAKVRQVAPGWTVQVCWGANAGWRATWERGLMAGLNLGRFAIVAYRCDLQTLMVKGVKALKAPATPQPEGT